MRQVARQAQRESKASQLELKAARLRRGGGSAGPWAVLALAGVVWVLIVNEGKGEA